MSSPYGGRPGCTQIVVSRLATPEKRFLVPGMTPGECEQLIAAGEQRLRVYLQFKDRLGTGETPFLRSLVAKNEERICSCELRLNELRERLAEMRRGL